MPVQQKKGAVADALQISGKETLIPLFRNIAALLRSEQPESFAMRLFRPSFPLRPIRARGDWRRLRKSDARNSFAPAGHLAGKDPGLPRQ